jgi:predicted RNase H-like HicB family nuclease
MPFVGRRPYIYRVVIELDDDRYHAEIPTLPGCYSWGRTYEEALRNIKEALELWLEAKLEDGESVPLKDPETVRAASYTVGVVL